MLEQTFHHAEPMPCGNSSDYVEPERVIRADAGTVTIRYGHPEYGEKLDIDYAIEFDRGGDPVIAVEEVRQQGVVLNWLLDSEGMQLLYGKPGCNQARYPAFEALAYMVEDELEKEL